MSSCRGTALAVLASAALALLLPMGAAGAATRAEQEGLLQKCLANPSDYATAFAYVRVSEELGDYEAAIGALERLLFYNPKLARVKYELGALYFQAHSYQLAVHYFDDALASPDIDAATRARIEAILPEAQKQASPVRSWVFVESGLRYQSNATSTPADGTVSSTCTRLAAGRRLERLRAHAILQRDRLRWSVRQPAGDQRHRLLFQAVQVQRPRRGPGQRQCRSAPGAGA